MIGSSGGCGVAALQLAKGIGMSRIVGICSSKNKDFCLANGATEIVPCDNPAAMEMFLSKNAGQIDVVCDAASCSGGSGEDHSDNPQVLALLKSSTTATSTCPCVMLNGSTHQKLQAFALQKMLGKTCQKQSMVIRPGGSTQILEMAIRLMDAAKLKPIVDSTHDFTPPGVEEAYDKLHSRRANGKIVISVSQPAESSSPS